MTSKKKSMDLFLREVFKHFIAIKDSDYKKSQTVFSNVFEQVKQKMCEQDNFFDKYSSQVLFAGSVYDGIKVGKLDEFDMDIVIRLPINYDDGDNGIIIEHHKPGFVKLKIINSFDHMDKQKDWEKCHKVTRDWRDKEKYFLQSKFRQWLHGIVQRAVNELKNEVKVDGQSYKLTYKESGPAFTLNVRSLDGEFALDVDLVPVIRFLLPRWPVGYRSTPNGLVKEWLVVPKPLKSISEKELRDRCWRLAFHDHEKDVMKNCELLKFTIRLLKKLRDSLELKKIASYYIKTLFLWEIDAQDKKFWQNKVTFLFTYMVEKLHRAITVGEIKYYWHEDHNLIADLKPTLKLEYTNKLNSVLEKLQNNDVDGVIACLLTPNELTEFRSSDFYSSYKDIPVVLRSESKVDSASEKNNKNTTNPEVSPDNGVLELLNKILYDNKRLESKLESLVKKVESKVDGLCDKVAMLEDKVDLVLKINKENSICVQDVVDSSTCDILVESSS